MSRRLGVCDKARLKPACSTTGTNKIIATLHHIIEPVHEISNNVVCATSKASDQPAHTHSLIRAFASSLSILWLLSY